MESDTQDHMLKNSLNYENGTIEDISKNEDLTEEQLISLERAFSYAKQVQELYHALIEKMDKKIPRRIADSSQNSTTPDITTTKGIAQLHTISILCRIYIGSIYFELTEADIRRAFSPFGCIKVVSMTIDSTTGHHKGYCFLEYETPDAASLALECMNGAILGGRSIRVGRSNNFPAELPLGCPSPVPQRLYVSNIHEAVTESDLGDIFSSFGTVKHCIIVPDLITHKHKHYGYVEFEHERIANTALNTMKEFQLGGQALKIRKSVLGGELPMGMNLLKSTGKVYPSKASGCVVVLSCSLSFNTGNEINDIICNAYTECSRIGKVLKIVPINQQSEKIDLYVIFEDIKIGNAAVNVLNQGSSQRFVHIQLLSEEASTTFINKHIDEL